MGDPHLCKTNRAVWHSVMTSRPAGEPVPGLTESAGRHCPPPKHEGQERLGSGRGPNCDLHPSSPCMVNAAIVSFHTQSSV